MSGDKRTRRGINRRSFTKTAATVLAGGVGLSAASTGVVADKSESGNEKDESGKEPCFPETLEIEVKPGNGNQTDPINTSSKGVIPVAVLQTETFDPTERQVSYRFDAAGKVGCDSAEPVHGGHVEDVNDDGDDDLVLHFDAEETNFEHGDTEAELLWVESKGDHDKKQNGNCDCRGRSGTDHVRVVGKR